MENEHRHNSLPLIPSETASSKCGMPASTAVDVSAKTLESELKESAQVGCDTSPNVPNAEWLKFQNAFSKRDRGCPFPDIAIASEVFCGEIARMVATDATIQSWINDCKDAVMRRKIASDFLQRFSSLVCGEPMDLMVADPNATYWVVGDIHAKLAPLAKICAFINKRRNDGHTKARNILILLGDYIDRGDEPLETLAFIERLKIEQLFDGLSVITLAGNHDVGLGKDSGGKYTSSVSPAETADFFNTSMDSGVDVSVEADAAIRLAKISRRMCELTKIDSDHPERTILFTHGGIPHTDLQEKLFSQRGNIVQQVSLSNAISGRAFTEDLRSGCESDFTWVRLSDSLPTKRPNRGSSGCEIGTEDVAQYIYLHRALTGGREISFIFRGHDHEKAGFRCYSEHPLLNPSAKKFTQRECGVLTLNAMEPDLSSGGIFRERDIALAEWSIGGPVKLHKLITEHLAIKTSEALPSQTRTEQSNQDNTPEIKNDADGDNGREIK